MCPKRLTRTLIAGAVGLALSTALLAVSTPARAEDDDVAFDTKILRGLLESLGLQRDGPGINYEDRPPLVLPPNRDLPPPENSNAAIANNPAWPKDPDVIRAKLERQRELNRNGTQEMEDESKPLRPDQLNPKLKPGTRSRHAATPTGTSNLEDKSRLLPSELGYTGGFFGKMFGSKEEADGAKFTGEVPRAALTDPPPGYQTPSPNQPYGVGSTKSTPKATDYFTEHGTRDD